MIVIQGNIFAFHKVARSRLMVVATQMLGLLFWNFRLKTSIQPGVRYIPSLWLRTLPVVTTLRYTGCGASQGKFILTSTDSYKLIYGLFPAQHKSDEISTIKCTQPLQRV